MDKSYDKSYISLNIIIPVHTTIIRALVWQEGGQSSLPSDILAGFPSYSLFL